MGKSKKRNWPLSLLLVALPVVAALLCMGFGRYSLGIVRTLEVLFSPLTGETVSNMEWNVVFNLRPPRILLAACCGAALSASGIAFQSLFNNPLATPDTLGTTTGSSCGAVIALMLGLNMVAVQILAMVFGLLAVALTWSLSKVHGKNSIIMIILSGMVISALFEAIVSLLKYVADPNEVLPTITYWLMGSLASANFGSLLMGFPFIAAGLLIVYLLRWRLNILALSEDEARSMGIDLKKMRILVILAATMMTASCVSMCGKIGWVGLLIPHISRMLQGGDNRLAVPACISLGATFTLIIDTVARSAAAAEIPISILTAIIGAPVFISLLRKTGGLRSE